MAEQSKTYCPLPFIHSHAGLNGKYKPCCNSDSLFNHWDYHIEKLGYNDWFKHPEMDKLRNDLLKGVKNKMCDVCWRQEETSNTSYRTNYIRKYQNDKIDHKNPKITYIDIKLSNECNLGCRHCDYTNTTQIHKDMIEMEKLEMPLPSQWGRSPGFERRVADKDRDDMYHKQPKKVVDELIELMPNLKHLKVTGGEPTITKEFFRLVEYAVDNDYAKNLNFYITTNGTRFTPDFIEKLQHFKNLYLTVSCDGYGEAYEYIRYPFTWKMFEKRLKVVAEHLKSKEHNIRSISFNCVAQMQNLENISKLENWIWELFGDKASLHVQPHINPSDSTNEPSFLPKHILEKALSDIEITNAKTGYDLKMYTDMLKYMISNHNDENIFKKYRSKEALKKMKDALINIDKVRNQNYKKCLEPLTVEWVDSLDV